MIDLAITAAFHQRRDRRQLRRINDRANVDAFVHGIANPQPVHAAFQPGMEHIRDAFLHQKARPGAAHLALIEPDRIDQPFDGAVNIGVIKHDIG